MSKLIEWECKIALIDNENICYTGVNRPKCRAKIKLDDLTREILTRFDSWVADNILRERKDLELLGRLLYSVLFPTGGENSEENLRDAFESDFRFFLNNKSNERDRLRLTLEIHREADELSKFPWEFLFMLEPLGKSGFFLAGEKTELILTRYVPNVPGDSNLKTNKEEPLRILVIFSHPDGLPPMDSKLTRDIIQQIKDLEDLKNVEVRIEENPTHKRLFKLINGDEERGDAKKNPGDRSRFQPHIIHFIGHGEPGKLALMRDAESIQEDEDNSNSRPEVFGWYSSDDIIELFNKHTPHLVFLHACEGAKPSSVGGFSDLARDLVYAKVPVVLAMRYTILNRDAALFAKTFYEKIRNGGRIDEAVQAGRATLGQRQETRRGWSDRRFGTPVVYLQSKCNQALIDREEPEPERASKAPCSDRPGFNPNVKVPCPGPRCDCMLTLDSILCIVCSCPVMRCPGCEGKGNHFLFSKTAGMCGRCGYRAPDIRPSAAAAASAMEAALPITALAQPEDEAFRTKPPFPATSSSAPVIRSLGKEADHISRPDQPKGD